VEINILGGGLFGTDECQDLVFGRRVTTLVVRVSALRVFRHLSVAYKKKAGGWEFHRPAWVRRAPRRVVLPSGAVGC
jgi:hypothetical protein